MSQPCENQRSFSCCRCPAVKEAKRVPRGWKIVAEGKHVCGVCRSAGFVQRVVSLPVVEVVSDPTAKPWTPFYRAWDLATSLANWCQTEFLRHDAVRGPDDATMPKFDAKMFPGGVNLYTHWNRTCPFREAFVGASGSAAQMIRQVEQRWASHPNFGRFAVLWKRDAASPTARWPQPWVVRRQDYRLEMIGGEPHASITLPGGRVTLRLASDANWRRDLRRFRQVVDETATGGDLRAVAKFRDGVLVGVTLRISAMFEARPQEQEEGVEAVVCTGKENLLTVTVPGRQPFVFCGDDLVGKQAAYDRWRQRAAIDLKHEKRWPKAKREKMVLSNQQAAANAANRVGTWIEQLVAMVVGHEDKRTGEVKPGYLVRNRVEAVVYDDSCKEFIRRFEWHSLREKMTQRCAELGIRFHHAANA